MRPFLTLSLCLFLMTSLAHAEKVVVEKIVSDATAIETIVFESAPAHSQRISTSFPNSIDTSKSKHVIDVDEALGEDQSTQIAQLAQGSSRRLPKASAQTSLLEPYMAPDSFSEIDPLLQVVTLVKVDKSKRRMYLLKGG